VIGIGVAISILVLTILFVYADVFVIRSTAAPKLSTTSMTVRVVGRDWFWEVRYPGTDAVTANEIHIPVGTRVRGEQLAAWVVGFGLYQWLSPVGPHWWTSLVAHTHPGHSTWTATLPSFVAAFVLAALAALRYRRPLAFAKA
jgi:hypothetical protein